MGLIGLVGLFGLIGPLGLIALRPPNGFINRKGFGTLRTTIGRQVWGEGGVGALDPHNEARNMGLVHGWDRIKI